MKGYRVTAHPDIRSSLWGPDSKQFDERKAAEKPSLYVAPTLEKSKFWLDRIVRKHLRESVGGNIPSKYYLWEVEGEEHREGISKFEDPTEETQIKMQGMKHRLLSTYDPILDKYSPATPPIEPLPSVQRVEPIPVPVIAAPVLPKAIRIPPTSPLTVPQPLERGEKLSKVLVENNLLDAIRGPKDLDGIAIGVHLFGKRNPTDKEFDVLVYHGSNRFLNLTTGQSFNLPELLKEFRRGGVGVMDKEAVDKVKDATIRRRADTNLKRLTLDIETSMGGQHSSILDKTYSLGVSRHFDKTRTNNVTGKSIALFRHQRDGQFKLATANIIYNDTRAHMDRARHTIGEASDSVQIQAEIDRLHKQGILTQGDTSYLKEQVVPNWDANVTKIKGEVDRYLQIKEQFLKSEVAGHLRFSGESAGRSVYDNIGIHDRSKFSHEFFDRGEFDNFVEDYLKGDLKVQDRMLGREGFKHTLRHSGLQFLKKNIAKGNVEFEDAKQLAREFYQGQYRKEYRFKNGETADEIFKKNIDIVRRTQQREGHNLLIDLKGRKGRDNQHLNQMLFQNVHEVMGNHGSLTETGFHGDSLSVIMKNLKDGRVPSYLQDMTANKVKDSMGSMIDGLSKLTAAQTHTGGIVDHEGIKSAFYELYGSNENFSRLTGVPSSEVKGILTEATELIYNKYGGNKSVQNLMNIMKILVKEPHRAGMDAAYHARAASMMANDQRELELLQNKPRRTQFDEYRIRELGMKYGNAVFSQLVINRNNKTDFNLRPEEKEKQSRLIIRELETFAKRRNNINPERATKLKAAAARLMESELRTSRHMPDRTGFMLEKSGASNWKQFLGGALLFAGVEAATKKLSYAMSQSPFVKKEDDGQQTITGLSHNGIQTIIDRLNTTDFGSGYKGQASTLRSIWKIFHQSLDDTKSGRRVKTMMSNINTRMRRSTTNRGNVAQRIGKTARGSLYDFGRVVRTHFPKAGEAISGFAKKTTIMELLSKHFIEPIRDLRTGKTPLTKIVPSIMHNRVGRFMLAAGAITGVGLYALSSRSVRNRQEELNEKSKKYTKKNRVSSSNPWPRSNADKLADIMNSSHRGIAHGGLQRQLNRTEMTDFRSALVPGAKVAAAIGGVILPEAGRVARAAGAAEHAVSMLAKAERKVDPIAAIEREVSQINGKINENLAKLEEENPLDPTKHFGSTASASTRSVPKIHKWGDIQEQSTKGWLPGSREYVPPQSHAFKLNQARYEAVEETRRAIARTRQRLLQPGEYKIENYGAPGPQSGANAAMHVRLAQPSSTPYVSRGMHTPPPIDRNWEAKAEAKAFYSVGKSRVTKAPVGGMRRSLDELDSMAAATDQIGAATEARRPIARVPANPPTPRVQYRHAGSTFNPRKLGLRYRANIQSINMLQLPPGQSSGFGGHGFGST